MKKRENLLRFMVVGVLFCAVCMVYVGRLIYLQVAGQDYYTMSQPKTYVTRTVPIQACRGEIYDRNGTALVTNRYTYDLQLDYGSFPAAESERNGMILGLLEAAERHEAQPSEYGSLPFEISETGNGLLVSFRTDFFTSGGARYRRFAALIDGLHVDMGDEDDAEASSPLIMGLADIPYSGSDRDVEDAAKGRLEDLPPAERCIQALLERYGLITYEDASDIVGTLTFSAEETAVLLCRRLDMELADFSTAAPYTLFSDISLNMVSHAEESWHRGIRIHINSTRQYEYPGYASHILGTVGKIDSDELEYYTEQGYAMDAIVGKSGVESAFEEYLRGVDGVLTITEDTYGNIVSSEVTTYPIAGRNVYLTIDIGLQMAAEIALAQNVQQIRDEADPENPLSGEDASAGALVAVKVDTGAVLAIASYPTYNLATLRQDIGILNTDETSPILNRALQSAYAPGSTFKVGVAAAALEEKIIEKDTIIDAKGTYTVYEDYQPSCWVVAHGGAHGKISVIEAIQESCNYFFFEVGRLLSIEKINEHMQHFGLGQSTGIELYEKTGILAGPEYRDDNGLDKWSPGDTLQAAIGQSDNLFTPLQICMYTTTLLNRGVRYSAHLLDRVSEYGGEVLFKAAPAVLDDHPISDEIYEIIREGMKNVMDNGSAARIFAGYPITVGGKTGTAQVYSTKSDNAIMTAFAPYENPDIAVTCVIEQGYSGTKAGYSIKDVFDYYFGVGE
ncbi:MAG: hypothetical protein IJ480_03740 [Clostridia bacterium]|nr:hypothetical protein [Clostridia bacterium]